MDENADVAWERFLNPDTLKGNIIGAAVYIVAFEILKDSIIDKIKSFYAIDFDADGPVESERYHEEVLSLNRSPLHASLCWLKENGAIDDEDIDRLKEIKTLRNRLAHELMHFLAGDGSEYSADVFSDLVQLLRKIELWWIVNFEMAVNPEDYPDDLDLNEVTPGRVFSLQLLINTALGSHNDAVEFYEEYLRQREN